MKPTKTDQLNQALRALRDAFEALDAAGVVGTKCFPEVPPARREHFVRLLARVHIFAADVNEIEQIAIGDENGPFLQADPKLVRFYETEFRSHTKDLPSVPTDLAYEYFSESFDHHRMGVDSSLPKPSTETALQGIVDFGLEMKYNALDDGWLNEDEFHSVKQDVRSFERLEESGLIDPDSWYRNFRQLKPVFSARPIRNIPGRVRQRIGEVYRSFIYENWLSTIAMSRALMEYAILERSGSIGLEAYKTKGVGMREPKSLACLVEVVAEKFPVAKEDLETVQSYGNEVMHPIKKGNVEVFPAMRTQALDCLSRLRRILTVLYTANSDGAM